MWQCYLQASRSDLDVFADHLADLFISSSLFEIDEKTDLWKFEGLFTEKNTCEDILTRINILSKVQHMDLPEMYFQEVPSKDWLAENRASFKPIEVGQFYIHSSYGDSSAPTNKTVLEIDASLAFGTGEHDTTKGCLIALEQLSSHYRFNNALDLGTGSAILAMAIAALYKCPTLATDIDPDAINVASNNIIKNGYKDLIICTVSDGFNAANFQACKPFDLIVANILAGPLIHLSGDIVNHLEDHGILVLSGLLIEQAKEVAKAYTDKGLVLIQDNTLGEWSILTLKKP